MNERQKKITYQEEAVVRVFLLGVTGF